MSNGPRHLTKTILPSLEQNPEKNRFGDRETFGKTMFLETSSKRSYGVGDRDEQVRVPLQNASFIARRQRPRFSGSYLRNE
jgi:hypothetical protein